MDGELNDKLNTLNERLVRLEVKMGIISWFAGISTVGLVTTVAALTLNFLNGG